jgi:AcrR family transcriptional regulator
VNLATGERVAGRVAGRAAGRVAYRGAATDGRVRRGERNRAAIVDALLALLEAGDPKPSARVIAARAGCSVRTVFQHFDDMETLYAAVVERQQERIAPMLEPIEASAPRAERVRALVAQRARVFERIAPVRRAGLRASASSPVLREGLERSARRFRRQLEEVFAPEVAGPGRRERLAALDLVCSFDAWDQLRTGQRLSVASARRVLEALVTAVAGGPVPGRPPREGP